MSYATSVVSRKGRTTIPAEIRRAFGLEQGDRIVWTDVDGYIRVERARSVTERTRGIAKSYGRNTVDGQQLIEEETEAFERAVALDALDLGNVE